MHDLIGGRLVYLRNGLLLLLERTCGRPKAPEGNGVAFMYTTAAQMMQMP